MSTNHSSEESALPRVSDTLRGVALPRAMRGYDRDIVDQLVANVAEMLDGLEDQVLQLESDGAAARDQLARVVAEATRDRAELQSARHELEARLNDTLEKREELERIMDRATRERAEFVAVIEQIKMEREERVAYTERLEREVTSHRELETSLKHMVVAAERIGNDLRALTEREATSLLEEARSEARKLLTEASTERDLILSDMRRIRAMLQAALGSLDERALLAQRTPDAEGTLDEDREIHL